MRLSFGNPEKKHITEHVDFLSTLTASNDLAERQDCDVVREGHRAVSLVDFRAFQRDVDGACSVRVAVQVQFSQPGEISVGKNSPFLNRRHFKSSPFFLQIRAVVNAVSGGEEVFCSN